MAQLRRVTIDVTPMLPGGANGGAKLVALSLIEQIAKLAPETEFILLTSTPNHAELADLETANVRRRQVDIDSVPEVEDAPGLARARMAGRLVVDTLLPTRARSHIKDAAWRILKSRRRRNAMNVIKHATDLHFCPFTAPFFADPAVPLVSLVHDLQFLDCPQFFDEQQRRERLQHFVDACERADRLICVSEFVRQTVLRNSSRSADSVTMIHSAVLHGISRTSRTVGDVLKRIGVTSSRYLFYPANAWPHKNHHRLVEAFASLPDSDLALVCTGAPSLAFDELIAFARSQLPTGRFGFAGYVSDAEYSALLHNCRAVVFPSLYEGFGMPVLEAMACERPVLCSNTSSLPEVAGDAALSFDPYDPATIAAAIQRLESDAELEASMLRLGKQRVAQFGSATDMATRYLTVFEDVVAARQRTHRS